MKTRVVTVNPFFGALTPEAMAALRQLQAPRTQGEKARDTARLYAAIRAARAEVAR